MRNIEVSSILICLWSRPGLRYKKLILEDDHVTFKCNYSTAMEERQPKDGQYSKLISRS